MEYTAFDRCLPEIFGHGICSGFPAAAGKMWMGKMAEITVALQEP
ncbi:hypothetical protein [Sinorhizobium sp. BG8]|nr:hypothetical protein [Sinorhizobium sp. BG8]